MSEKINYHRRCFLGTAALMIATTQLGRFGSANAQSSKPKLADLPTIMPGTNTSFGSLKQIDAGVLNVAYAEAGPADGRPVILLHGWPYGIHSYVDVAPLLAAAGYRAIVTGAASSIGVETARALASTGAEVTMAVRNTEAGAQVAVDITANALMSGAIATNLQRHTGGLKTPPERQKTLAQGAATSVLLATSPLLKGISGCYFEDCNEATLVTNGNGYMSGVAPYALNPDNADRLWEESLRLLA